MPTTFYVVDASVFVADAHPGEPHHRAANLFLQHVAAIPLPIYTPAIVLAEIAAAIARGHQRATLARRFVQKLQSFPHIEITAVDGALANLSAELAAQHRLRGCDAVYVALAQSKGATLISLDQEHKLRAPTTMTVRTPAEELALLPPLSPT